MERLVGAGIDPAAAERSGQLEIRTKKLTSGMADLIRIGCCIHSNKSPVAMPPEDFLLAELFVEWTGQRRGNPTLTTLSSLSPASMRYGNAKTTR
jgi:hypothetical protein